MSFERFLEERRLRPHRTNKDDLRHLLEIAERDIADAEVEGLSADRRFLIAYDAALTLSTIPLYSAGYETHGTGHHWVTFQLLPHFMGEDASDVAIYFESCRTKRNVGTYDRGGEISDAEADELLTEVREFKLKLERWLLAAHPDLSPYLLS